MHLFICKEVRLVPYDVCCVLVLHVYLLCVFDID
jgi:hypothetical protein